MNSYELPPALTGDALQQTGQLYSYIFRLVQRLNAQGDSAAASGGSGEGALSAAIRSQRDESARLRKRLEQGLGLQKSATDALLPRLTRAEESIAAAEERAAVMDAALSAAGPDLTAAGDFTAAGDIAAGGALSVGGVSLSGETLAAMIQHVESEEA